MQGFESICGQADQADIDELIGVTEKAFLLAAQIRQKLKHKGYLLEEYLSHFMRSALTCGGMPEESGFASGDDLCTLITRVMDGQTDESPFFGTVKSYVDTHPMAYHDWTTRCSLYAAALFGDYIRYQAKNYRDFLDEQLRVALDAADLENLRERINAIVGPEKMKKLERLLCRAFLAVLPMTAFFQKMNASLLYELTYRDSETGRPTVGLWLDFVQSLV